MIITGLSLLATSFTFLIIGAIKANYRPLLGAAVLAIAGVGFLAVGTLIAMQTKREEDRFVASPTGAVPAGPPGATAAPQVYVVYAPAPTPAPTAQVEHR